MVGEEDGSHQEPSYVQGRWLAKGMVPTRNHLMSRVDGWRRGWFPLGSIPGSTSPRSGPRQYPASPRLINLRISNQKKNELGRGNKKDIFGIFMQGCRSRPFLTFPAPDKFRLLLLLLVLLFVLVVLLLLLLLQK